MKIRYIVLTCLLGGLLWQGCAEESLGVYNTGKSSVYFGVKSPSASSLNKWTDTTNFSFVDRKTVDTVVNIPVNVLGEYMEVDRVFDFEIDGTSTAVEGRHYRFEQDQFVVPAGAVCGYIPIHLLKHSSLDNQKVMLKLKLMANENFGLELKREYVDVVNNRYTNLIEHDLYFTNMVEKPWNWYKGESLFLTYSRKKFLFINELCDTKVSDWNLSQFNLKFNVMWVRTRNALQDSINAGRPVYEDELDQNGYPVLMQVKGLVVK